MDVITEKPRPVVPHCGACCGASGPGQGAHAQYRPARSEAVTWPTGPGCGGRGRRRGLAGLRNRPRSRQARVWRSRGRAAAHGHIKQPGPTAGSNNTWNTSYTRNTSGPLPPPTDATHGRIKQPGPTDTRHQTRATRHAPGTPAGPQPQTRQSGPEPLGSGPPSILSDYRRHAPGGATRQVVPRARWHHATGAHRCTTAVRCQ